ncbi:MAG TPA: 30S ribosomal protein S12 methylthiotransferase RimO [Jatrophihabitantaceae bacterium]
MSSGARRVALVTLGCARNEVDSEELAARLGDGDWELTDEADADVLVVNTCGFVDAAKKDSIDTVLAAADTGKKVVAVGCLAERYGNELAEQLPEADAVLGFDSYADIAARLDDVAAGRSITPHTPRDRRTLLPVTPAHRPAMAAEVALPGHAWLPSNAARKRLDDSALAYLKIASGCDRRCTFCAIPSFRGSFVSRPPADVLAEARWLADQGARELVLVSENSTSYGKDLGDLRALENLLPDLAGVDGIERIRVSYLQPAELRPALLETIAGTPGVAPYFDLSFQHASPDVLRRMKRFGSTDAFLDILARAREISPELGARSNVIVGFPGETDDDLAELERFLTEARLDVVGVFGYSDEDGTEAEKFDDKLSADEIAARVEHISAFTDELMAQRAEDRVGELVEVLVEDADEGTGRAMHQGPETDGITRLTGVAATLLPNTFVPAVVVDSEGIDLVAEPKGAGW